MGSVTREEVGKVQESVYPLQDVLQIPVTFGKSFLWNGWQQLCLAAGMERKPIFVVAEL